MSDKEEFLPSFEPRPLIRARSQKPANPKRGERHRPLAASFYQRFPMGVEFLVEEFDEWATSIGIYNTPDDSDKQSDSWKAHLQRRYELRRNIRSASRHPRMVDVGALPFEIQTIKYGEYRVVPPERAIEETNVAKKLASLLGSKKEGVRFLRESIAWDKLDPSEMVQVQVIDDTIDSFARTVEFQIEEFKLKLKQVKQHFLPYMKTPPKPGSEPPQLDA